MRKANKAQIEEARRALTPDQREADFEDVEDGRHMRSEKSFIFNDDQLADARRSWEKRTRLGQDIPPPPPKPKVPTKEEVKKKEDKERRARIGRYKGTGLRTATGEAPAEMIRFEFFFSKPMSAGKESIHVKNLMEPWRRKRSRRMYNKRREAGTLPENT